MEVGFFFLYCCALRRARFSLMSTSTTPTQVTVDTDAQTVTIAWADDHTSEFPLDGLRRACPCAACRGDNKSDYVPDPSLFNESARRQWTDVEVEPVGSYGLRFHWDDGHNDGIYTWERLRKMSPQS